MARGVVTAVMIYDQSLYRPSGLVGRWMTKLTTRLVLETKRAAPKRSGRLANSVEGDTHLITPKIIDGHVSASAPYLGYVLHGTTGPIMSRRGWARAKMGLSPRKQFFDIKKRDRNTPRGKPLPGTRLAVGKQGLYPPIIRVTEVEGQSANNFFALAWRRAAQDHRVLRGVTPPALR